MEERRNMETQGRQRHGKMKTLDYKGSYAAHPGGCFVGWGG
ncbi:MAG: hypothetical protein AABY78_00560 [Nitrospirota bacterium]